MSTQVATYYDIVEQLPPGAVVAFTGVSWEEYQDLIDQLGEASHLRVSFDDGVLQAMTVSWEHENYASFFVRIMTVISLRMGLDILSFGSATMRTTRRHKGSEPDQCFYVQNAGLIGNRRKLDLDVDPPPDIVIEIDISHETIKKLPLYAAFGVPEVWRFHDQKLTIYLLGQGSYHESERSNALPFLTGQVLTDTLAKLSSEGETTAQRSFDAWLQTLHRKDC